MMLILIFVDISVIFDVGFVIILIGNVIIIVDISNGVGVGVGI